jgi:hypothetical protein
MKFMKQLLTLGTTLLVASTTLAHEGHGPVGSIGHDLQHQLWTFAGMILLGVVVLGGEHIAALVRRRSDKDDAER